MFKIKLNEQKLDVKNITKVGKKIIKNKILTPNQKLSLLFKYYSVYYNSDYLDNSAYVETLELYYEKFVINGVHYPTLYKKYYELSREDINYLNIVVFVQQTVAIKNIDISLCTKMEKDLYQYVCYISKILFNKQFDYNKYYINRAFREKVNIICWDLVDKIKKIDTQKNKTDAIK